MTQSPERKSLARRRGVAAVEFALILPLLLILTFGIIEYGWMLTKSGQILNAAREGCRVGARPDATLAEIHATIAARMNDAGMGGAYGAPSITPGASTGDVVTVAITVPYEQIELIGFPLVPTPANLHHEVSMSKEGP